MGDDKVETMVNACVTVTSGGGITPCVESFAAVVGWRCTVAVFGYAWLTCLFLLHSCVVRLSCGRPRGLEAGGATSWLCGHFWKTLIFVNIVLAPKDVKEWGFWFLWFSAAALLRLLTNIGKQHFENVVDNPSFGVLLTLRALSLHALVLWSGFHLAALGWREFYRWGEGPFGQVLLLPSSPHVSADFEDPNYVIDALTEKRCWYLDLVPVRGGMGFALMLLYDVLVTTAEMSLSALKYLANLFELYRGPLNSSGNMEAGLIEQTDFFVTLGLAILAEARTLHVFRACGRCSLMRKIVTRLLAIVNGSFALERIYRASWKVVLAKEMDLAFPNASEKELKDMPKDESCAICLKTMFSAKRLGCNHFFHAGCLQQYLNNSRGTTPLCPICRSRIPWEPPSSLKRQRSHNDAANGANAANTTTPANTHGQSPPDLQELPGIITGNAPRPDTFTRAARGAYGSARLVHNLIRAWRNDFELDNANVQAVMDHMMVEAANARSRAAAERMVVQGPGGGSGGAAAFAGVERAEGSVDGESDYAGDAARAAAEAEDAPQSGGRGFGVNGGDSSASGSGNGDWGITGGSSGTSWASDSTAAAEQLLEVFPEIGIDDARRRIRLAGGHVQRAAEQYLGAVVDGGDRDSSGSAATSEEVSASEPAGAAADPRSPTQVLRRRMR